METPLFGLLDGGKNVWGIPGAAGRNLPHRRLAKVEDAAEDSSDALSLDDAERGEGDLGP